MKTGIELIAQERQEQIEKHGRGIAYDQQFNKGSQLLQGIMLLVANLGFRNQGMSMPKEAFEDLIPDGWGREICFKMMNKPVVEQIAIIGAFAAAEIDRIQADSSYNETKP